MKKNKLVPRLRFQEFKDSGEWQKKSIEKSCSMYSGGTPLTHKKEFYGGKIPFIRSAEIDKNITELYITDSGLKNSSAKMVKKGDILIALYGANSGEVSLSKIDGAINQAILCLRHETNNYFLYHYLYCIKEWIVSQYLQGGQGNLSAQIIKSIILPFPNAKEQQKIADCLDSINELIDAEKRKLEALKKYKKALMQKLFPAEDASIPELRFEEFKDSGEWEEKQIKDVLDYERPDLYIVEDTDYKENGIPVLTANKSFILGYTDEINNIYNDIPVIIFDDFTTDKKYVDFPFKVKSSAIKILKSKNNNVLKFIYELLNTIYFNCDEHKRYYISMYQNINIFVPKSIKEHQKIADCLASIDNIINIQIKKIDNLIKHKKALMQGLFPDIESIEDYE